MWDCQCAGIVTNPKWSLDLADCGEAVNQKKFNIRAFTVMSMSGNVVLNVKC